MPEGEHFTPEMLDRDEHPNDKPAKAVEWSLEQMNAQAGRLIAGDRMSTGVAKAFAAFVVQECQSAMTALKQVAESSARPAPPFITTNDDELTRSESSENASSPQHAASHQKD